LINHFFLIIISKISFLIAFHSKPYSFNIPDNSKYLLNLFDNYILISLTHFFLVDDNSSNQSYTSASKASNILKGNFLKFKFRNNKINIY